MVYVSYLRVSTKGQGISGLGLEAQRHAVSRYNPAVEFVEVESGKNADRPQLAKALTTCRRLKATLLVAKLDRLSRNVLFLANLMESGVEFIAADMPGANRMTLHIMSAIAEGEAKAISDRTKAALAAVKARGVKLGGNRNPNLAAARQVALDSARGSASKRNAQVAWILRGMESATLVAKANKLNELGFPAARGGVWTAMQVSRVGGMHVQA